MLFSVGLCFAEAQQTYEEIPLQVTYNDPTIVGKPVKRSPIRIPSIGIDDHTLYFITSCDGCTLRLLNEDEEMVVNITIPDNSSTLNLPTYLEGESKYCIW